jgi:hypothetical protein
MRPVNGGRTPSALPGVPDFPRAPTPVDLINGPMPGQWPGAGNPWQGRLGTPPVNGVRTPSALPGLPDFPRPPTPADLMKGPRNGLPWENPGAIPPGGPVAVQQIPPELLRPVTVDLAKYDPPKFDPRPSPLKSLPDWMPSLRWIVIILCALGGACRGASRCREQ